jgi:hypothetical protein
MAEDTQLGYTVLFKGRMQCIQDQVRLAGISLPKPDMILDQRMQCIQDQVRLAGISLPKPDMILDQTLICTRQSQDSVERSTWSYWMMERIPHHKTSSTSHHVPGTILLRD